MAQLTEDQIREIFAESGKMKASQMMSYLKSRYAGQYDSKVARANAKEMAI